jgi:chromosome segregation ATPase
MGQSKLTLTIDEEVKEIAKDKYNVSQTVEKYLKEIISGPDTKEERVEEINQEIKDYKDKISEYQKKIGNLQSEKAVLEKQLNQEAKVTDEKHKFFRIAKARIQDNSWNGADDIPAYWRGKFNEDIEELWKLAKNSDADPAERKEAKDGRKIDSTEITRADKA